MHIADTSFFNAKKGEQGGGNEEKSEARELFLLIVP